MTVAELDIIALPFLAGLLIVATHVPLGREVLHRGIIFIDLAVAQIAGLGVIVALWLGREAGDWVTQGFAVVSALLGATLLAALAPSEPVLWVAGILIGIFVGPNQAACGSQCCQCNDDPADIACCV